MWNVVGDFLRGYLGLIRVAENINEIFELGCSAQGLMDVGEMLVISKDISV